MSAAELVAFHIERAEDLNRTLNAIVVPDFERALQRAAEADRLRAAGERIGPLNGVPFTVKECIEVEGLELCEASTLRPPVRSGRDAEVVARLRAAGAIPLGKTNISELAFFPDSTNLVYGSTRNPHDLALSASGSSGGEAVAVAARMSAFGIGSDYGGSIRGPAHAVGVVGIRPGPGTVPISGHAPAKPTPGRTVWSTIGPLTRSVDDAAFVLSAISEPAGSPVHVVATDPPEQITLLRDEAGRPLSSECDEALSASLAALEDHGHRVVEATPPRQLDAERMFGEVTLAETKHSIGSLLDSAGGADVSSLSPQLAWQWEEVRDLEADLGDYLTAFSRRAEIESAVDAWMKRHPLLIAPVAATAAHPLGARTAEVAGREVPMFEVYAGCAFASALSLPAIAVPAGRSPEGLPIAVQVIGRRGREDEVLAAAGRIELALGGWREPPTGPLRGR